MNARTLSLLAALIPGVALAQDDKANGARTPAAADVTPAPAADVAPPSGWSAGGLIAASDKVRTDLSVQTSRLYANCDGSTVQPIITVNDIVCFFNHVALGSPYANCDQSTVQPLITANDFVCFLNAYNQALAAQAASVINPGSVIH